MSAGLFQQYTGSRSTCPNCDSPLQRAQLRVHRLGVEFEPEDDASDARGMWSAELLTVTGKVRVKTCPSCGLIVS
jgi:hypothetical protein